MVITCFHHSWSWSGKLVQFESGDGLTGNQMIQSEYRLVAMACAYFLEKQRKKVKPNLKLMALLDLHMNHGSRCWAIPCCYVDCMKCFKVQGKFIIPCSSKQQWHPALTPHNGIQHGTTSTLSKCVKTTPAYCIQQWHPAMARYWHPSMASSNPAMAPHHMAPSNGTLPWHPASSNGTQQPAMAPTMASSNGTLPPSNGTTSSLSKCHNHSPPIAPSNGTLPHGTQQWHLTMAPSNGTTSSLSKCVITTPRLLHPAMAAALAPSTQQWHPPWHPAMAPYHGTLPWHPAMAPRPLYCTQQWHPSNGQHAAMAPNNDTHHGILPSHLTMAPSNGTTSSLSPPIASSNGTQQWNLTTWHPAGTQQWHLTMAPDRMPPSNGSQQRQCHPAMAAQQWQPATAPRPIRQVVHLSPYPHQWQPAMAPSKGTQQRHHIQSANLYTHPPLSPAMAPSNGTQQWHPATAPHANVYTHPSSYPQQWPPAMAAQQWHPATAPSNVRHHIQSANLYTHPPLSPAMAPSNGSQQRHHVQSANVYTHPRPYPQQWQPSNGTQQRHHINLPTCTAASNGSPAMAPSNGTHQWQPATAPPPPYPQQWHPAMAASNGTTSNFRTCTPTPPPIGSKNPYS